MPKFPKISIVTPSLNQGKFIERTVLSVLSQNYPNLEYIVVDGGSTDGTIKILNKYRKKIKIIIGKDKGQTDAINKGFNIAKGEILAYLNSDDVYLTGALHKVTEFFSTNKDIKWVTGNCRIIDEDDRSVRSLIYLWKYLWLKVGINHGLRKNILYILNYISQPPTFFRREIWGEYGNFNDGLHYSMDYDYWLRIIEKYNLGFIDEDIAQFRIHRKSKSVLMYKKQLSEGQRIVRKYGISGSLYFLHRIHDLLAKLVYQIIN